MKLFTVGPVEMYPETLQVSGTQLPYFRNDEFSSIMKENEQQLLTLCGCRKGRALFLCGSGSAAMEAVVACSFRRQDKVLILRGGSFGERFVQLCRIYGIPYDELCLQELEALRKEHLDAFFKMNIVPCLSICMKQAPDSFMIFSCFLHLRKQRICI